MARKRSLREKLEVARAELRGTRTAIAKIPDPVHDVALQSLAERMSTWTGAPLGPALVDAERPSGPPRFVQIVGVQRGYSAFLHALDETGQVWELHTLFGPKEQGQKTGPIADQWWERVRMDRR